MIVDCGIASAALPGQPVSGDRIVIVPFPHGALIALVDGLGHGSEADVAATAAVNALQDQPAAPLEEIISVCHAALRGTRGAVVTIAAFDDRKTMTWVGVGNVEAVLVRADVDAKSESIVSRGGIVGFRLPTLYPRTLHVEIGDTLVLASDGIRPGFKIEATATRTPQEIADQILAGWATGRDDAAVVVARYRGSA